MGDRERLEKAGWCLVVDDPGGVVSWINGHLNYMGTVPTNVAIQIENYKDAAVKEATEKTRAEVERLRGQVADYAAMADADCHRLTQAARENERLREALRDLMAEVEGLPNSQMTAFYTVMKKAHEALGEEK